MYSPAILFLLKLEKKYVGSCFAAIRLIRTTLTLI